MVERWLLALLILSPMLVMAGMWWCASLVHASRPRSKELIVAVAIFAGLGVLLVNGPLGGNTATYLRFQREEWLWAVIPMFALILWLQNRTLSGISRGRMWLSFLLRTSIMILLLLALAGLQMVIEQDTLSVLYVLDASKSVPETERQRAIDFIKKTLPEKRPDDKVGLLVFGGRAEWKSLLPRSSRPRMRAT